MNIQTQGMGSIVKMMTSDPLHFSGKKQPGPAKDDVTTSFSNALMKSLNRVNDLQVDSKNLMQKMIYEPESTDIHSVMIAAQKAEIALSFTKSIRDEAVRAYKELINLR